MRWHRARRILLAAVLAVSACSQATGFDLEVAGPTRPRPDGPTGPRDRPVDDEPMRPTDPRDPEPEPARDAQEVVLDALDDVESYWSRTFEDVFGEPYEPVAQFVPYGPDTPDRELPRCGGRTSYEDVAENAFYCPLTDVIAWDLPGLIEPLIEEFGAFTVAVVMAHEFGHAIQGRSGVFETPGLQSVTAEIQADCYAGAWMGDVAAGNADHFAVSLEELDGPIRGIVEVFADPIGISPDQDGAHGSGFDRVSAFQDGFLGGARRCAGYVENPPDVVQIPFSSREERASGGDLPTDVLLPAILPDLEIYFETIIRGWEDICDPVELAGVPPRCSNVVIADPDRVDVDCPDAGRDLEDSAFYCDADNTIYLDGANLLPDLEEIGDFAVAAEIVRGYARSAQLQIGFDGTIDAVELNADCLAGAYSGTAFREELGLTVRLSPGDLDEVLIAYLQFPIEGTATTVFERSDAFRTGFNDGPAACTRIR